MHAPGGMQAVHKEYTKLLKELKRRRIFDLGVPTGGTILIGRYLTGLFLIWGYTEKYNLNLGAHEYQKVENP